MTYRPEWEEPERAWRGPSRFGRSATSILIAICVILFLVLAITENFFQSSLLRDVLMLSPANMFWVYPFATYMFLHDTGGIMHLLVNCLVLFFFGTQVEQAIGRSRYLALFFLSGLIGAIAHVLLMALFFPQPSPIYGASGAALGILFYAAWAWPNTQVIFLIFPMRLRTLAYILLAFDLYPLLIHGPGADGVAHFCHLAGAAMGVVYYKRALDPLAFLRRFQARRSAARDIATFERRRNDDAESDRILDKINAQGIGSLSRSERKFLDERSKALREGRGR